MAGDTGRNVNQRFYGYRLGRITRKEMKNTEGGKYESAKHRIHASMNCSSDFLKVTAIYEREN